MYDVCFKSSKSSLSIGSDAILLGAETLRGLYPVETISIVGKICAEVKFSSFDLITAAFAGLSLVKNIIHNIRKNYALAMRIGFLG